MSSAVVCLNQTVPNSNWVEDLDKIKDEIKSLNPFLLECPRVINFIGSQLQSTISYSSMKNLMHKVSLDLSKLIIDNLDSLLLFYSEDPLCRICNDFLNSHRAELLQIKSNPKEFDEKFAAFEKEYAQTPLYPFLEKIKECFKTFSYISEEDRFQLNFEKNVQKIILGHLIQNKRKNAIHHSNGHCHGAFLALAAPLKGMNAAFTQAPHNLHPFFKPSFNRDITSRFGTKFCNDAVFRESVPLTSKIVKGLCQTNEIQNTPYYKELLGRIAIGHVYGARKVFGNYQEGIPQEVTNLTKGTNFSNLMWSTANLKIIGRYITQHLSEFEEILPKKNVDLENFEMIGQYAIDIFYNYDTLARYKAYGQFFTHMFYNLDKEIGPKNLIKMRGLALADLVEFEKPIHDLYCSLKKIDLRDTDHYELVIRTNAIAGDHALYLGKKGSSFIFADPNFYDPTTLQPLFRSFSDIDEFYAFIYLYTLSEYSDTNIFHILKYSEIPVCTPHMREYQFGQSLARRNLVIHEGLKLNSYQELLKEKLQCTKEEKAIEKINSSLLQIDGVFKEIINNELEMFQSNNKLYIEEKITDYTRKFHLTNNKSYKLVIDSLRELLNPIKATLDGV